MNIKLLIIYTIAGAIGLSMMPVIVSFALHAELFNFDFSVLNPSDRFHMAVFAVICFIASVLLAVYHTGEQK